MNKTILYTTIISILSFSGAAYASSEDELKSILATLGEQTEIKEITNEKEDLNLNNDNNSESELASKDSIQDDVDTLSSILENKTLANKDDVVEVNTYSASQEANVNVEQDQFEGKPKEEIASHDHIFLLNVPIRTKIKPNEDLYIYPYRDVMIFDDGKLVSSNPLKYSDTVTFCYFNVEKSGNVRRLKADSQVSLSITGNKSIKEDMKSNIIEGGLVKKYETTFTFDNPHIKSLRCISTETDKPLTLGEFNFETGNKFNIIFPPIVDI